MSNGISSPDKKGLSAIKSNPDIPGDSLFQVNCLLVLISFSNPILIYSFPNLRERV
jgi:hypothetical protein